MSIAAVFDVPGMTQAQYEQVIRDLDERGASSPDGRMAHVGAAKPGGWWVVDVWESTEHLNRFVPVLMPVLSGAGVTPPTPTILPIHTITLP
jgi:hypothetical protein